jgi:hypothetical protein
MLVSGEDAVMKKCRPMIRRRREDETFAYDRSNPGPKDRFRNVPYRMFFPRLHRQMRGGRAAPNCTLTLAQVAPRNIPESRAYA